MQPIEINVSACSVQERAEIAAAMVRNGYRVCLAVKKDGNVKKTFLVLDKPEETGGS